MQLEKTQTENKINSFMDFCAGIGSGRLGLEKSGLCCVGFSEIDKKAENTYKLLFGNKEKNYGDLMTVDTEKLPDFDLLLAGFPCQTFSVVGQRKGLNDDRGQIIYGLIKILKEKNVPYFILENVKGLVNHNKGQTLTLILSELENAGYKVFHKVLNSSDYNIPQMRERIYFVGVKKEIYDPEKPFTWPEKETPSGLSAYLISKNASTLDEKEQNYTTFKRYLNNKYNQGKYKIEELLKENLLVLDTRQSDLRLYKNKVPTLRTGRHGILYVKNGKFKKLSGMESLLLQGFPLELAKKAEKNIEESHLLKQAGNAMTVTVIEKIAKQLLKYAEQSKNE